MSFDNADLALVGYANGRGLYMYGSDDTSATIETAGYLDEAVADKLKVGDVILATVDEDTTFGMCVYGVSVVNAAGASIVSSFDI